MALTDSFYKWAFPEYKFTLLVGKIISKILLNLSMLMIIYSNTLMIRQACNISYDTSFAC